MNIGLSAKELASLGLNYFSSALAKTSEEITNDSDLNQLLDQRQAQKFSEYEALVVAAAMLIEQNNQLLQKQLEALGVLPSQK